MSYTKISELTCTLGLNLDQSYNQCMHVPGTAITTTVFGWAAATAAMISYA